MHLSRQRAFLEGESRLSHLPDDRRLAVLPQRLARRAEVASHRRLHPQRVVVAVAVLCQPALHGGARV